MAATTESERGRAIVAAIKLLPLHADPGGRATSLAAGRGAARARPPPIVLLTTAARPRESSVCEREEYEEERDERS